MLAFPNLSNCGVKMVFGIRDAAAHGTTNDIAVSNDETQDVCLHEKPRIAATHRFLFFVRGSTDHENLF